MSVESEYQIHVLLEIGPNASRRIQKLYSHFCYFVACHVDVVFQEMFSEQLETKHSDGLSTEKDETFPQDVALATSEIV